MRRGSHTEQNLGEKRVLLGSLNKKNNLRITYEKLSLEKKAFISSTQFNQRQLLSRQTKLRQLQTQGNKDTRPKTRTSFPGLSGASESLIRSYSNNLSLPYSRNGLRSPGEGKQLSSSLGKDGSGGIKQPKPSNMHKRNSEPSTNFFDVKDVSIEKRNEIKTQLKQKSGKVEKDLKHVHGSGLHVGDIIAYSASFGKREKPQRGISSIDQEDVRIEEDEFSEPTNHNKNFAVRKPTVWKNDLDSFASTENNVSDTDTNSDRNTLDPRDRSNNTTNRQRSPRVLSKNTTLKEGARNGDESIVFPSWLPKDINLKDSNNLTSITAKTNTNMLSDTKPQSDELKSESQFMQTQESPNVSISFQETNNTNISIRFNSNSPQAEHTEEQIERSASSTPALVSRTPSWNGTKDLPALGRIRRGSFCDVKTFTSGKVLDLLSSCEIPSTEKKNKQFLDVENENLKYCRYLRSASTEDINESGESLEIPLKYRPSKNIIIGHTKVNPLE